MHPLTRAALVLVLLASPLAITARVWSALAGPGSPPVRPLAYAAADMLGDHYADLELAADSVVAAQSAEDAAPSELAQVTARNLARRIHSVSGDYDSLSVAMTAAEYERGQSLWLRLALAQAALERLEEHAARLGEDPATGPADVRDLADQLSGVLELGRVTGRAASRVFGAPAAPPRNQVPAAPCATCSVSLPAQS